MGNAITQDDAITKSVGSVCALLDRKRPEQAQQILATGPLVGKHLAFAMSKCMIAQRLDALEVFFNHLDTTPHDPEAVFPIALKCAAQCFASVDTFVAILQRTPQTTSALLGAVMTLIQYEYLGEDDDALKKFTALCQHASEDAMAHIWGPCVEMNMTRFVPTAHPFVKAVSDDQLYQPILRCFRSRETSSGRRFTAELTIPEMFEKVIELLSSEQENQLLDHLRNTPTNDPSKPDCSQVRPVIQQQILRKQLGRVVEQPLKTAQASVRKM